MSARYIIGIAFRLINFGMLLWFGYWVFKRYLLPFFRDQMHARTVAINQLHAAHHILIKDIRDVERALIDDRHEQDRLKERVNQWHESVQKKRELIDQKRKEQDAVTSLRIATQIRQIQITRLFAQAMPSALAQARTQLYEKFSNPQAQEKYLHRVTTRLKGA